MPLDGSSNYYYPPGTPGVPNQTIESEAYNTFLDDLVTNDLNIPRPISRGGTGASTATEALTNLGGFPSAGGTMTGSIVITPPVGLSAAIALNKPSTGLDNVIYGLTNNAQRWQLHLGNTEAETGGGLNTGSNFEINRVLDNGDVYQNIHLARTGGAMTLTGPLIVNDLLGSLTLNTTTTSTNIYGKKANKLRWQIQIPNATAESGSNAGSDFQLRRYNDAGDTELGTVLTIYRNNGLIEFNGLVRTNVGRFVSQEPTCASFGLHVAGSVAAGMYGVPGANIIRWGQMDDLGQPVLEWASLSATQFAALNIFTTGTITANGGITSANLTTGNINASAIAASSVAATGNITTASTSYSSGGRIISQHTTAGAHPSVCVYNVAQATAWGMYVHTDNALSWGITDAAGVPTGRVASVTSSGTMQLTGMLKVMNLAEMYFGATGVYRQLSFGTGYYWQLDNSNGLTQLYVNGTLLAGGNPGNNGWYAYTQGYKPGGGDWADSSDVRIKNVIGDYDRGLEEIIRLRPVLYTFKGNDTTDLPAFLPSQDGTQRDVKEVAVPYENSPHHHPAVNSKKFAGLIAQEVEAIIPEMVTKSAGYIDGVAVTDLRDLDTTPLIFALINSIKELTARVEQLEAAG